MNASSRDVFVDSQASATSYDDRRTAMHGSGIPAIFSCRESWTDRVGADLCVRPGADTSVGPYVRVTKPTAPSGTNRYCVGAVLPTHRVSSAIVIVRLSAGRWIGTI